MSMPHTCQCRICQREMTNFTALNTVNALAAELAKNEAAYNKAAAGRNDILAGLRARVAALEAAIRGWMHEGRMQTFGDRERMRAEMASCLPMETKAEHVHRWSGMQPDAFCEDCLAERYPTENPEGA